MPADHSYADIIDILGLNNRAVSAAFSSLDKEEKNMGVVANEISPVIEQTVNAQAGD